MSGGGGGSKKKKKKNKDIPVDPSFLEYANVPVVTTIQPFIGNNQELLAQQLNAGFGGGVQPYMDQMNNVYRPTQTVGLLEPLTETQKALEKGHDFSGSTGLISLDRILKPEQMKK
jgi:hypothetical protein